jgi:hypothetical protein
MADPLSILAIIALAVAGKKLSSAPPVPDMSEKSGILPVPEGGEDTRDVILNNFTGNIPSDPGLGSFGTNSNKKMEQPSFGDIGHVTFVNGMPVQDFRDRPWVSGQMNNLAPVEKVMVGPGLGLDPNTPAQGGYQQLFRPMPNNVGAYKLTQLPGRAGPRDGTITGGAAPSTGTFGMFAQNRPEKTTYLPDRYAPVKSRAQGQGGALTGVEVRQKYEKGFRTTNRSETGLRNDGLSTAPAKKFILGGTLAQDPTRNKADLNNEQFGHFNNPSPGIHSFVSGYDVAPTDIRVADKRGNQDRMGNAGRMNVRANAVNQGGQVTSFKQSYCPQQIMAKGPTGVNGQQYVAPMFQQNNVNKGNINPRATGAFLNTAKNQLAANPLAHTLSV